MEKKEKDFIRKINIDKAKNNTRVAIILILLSIGTYIEPFIYGEYDFGIVFEIVSLIYLIIARNYMLKYDEIRAKKYIICSIMPIAVILIYDIIYINIALLNYYLLYGELNIIAYLMTLFLINRNLSKIDDPEKYKESTDWFYEKYEEKENKGKKIM